MRSFALRALATLLLGSAPRFRMPRADVRCLPFTELGGIAAGDVLRLNAGGTTEEDCTVTSRAAGGSAGLSVGHAVK